MLGSLLLIASSLSSTSEAAPTWRWSSTPVRYHAELSTSVRQAVEFDAQRNTSGRWVELWIGLDTSCTGAPQKKGWKVSCTLSNVQFAGKPMRSTDAEGLTITLEEWSATLQGKTVVMTVDASGRLKKLDLQGIEGNDSRTNDIVDQMRTAMYQAFRLFDLPLPTDDAAWASTWKQKGDAPLFHLWSVTGSVGAWDLHHRQEVGPGGQKLLKTEGKGTVQQGEKVDGGVDGVIYIEVGGTTVFDEALGLMTYRQVAINASTSNALAEAHGESWFTQEVTVSRLADLPAP